MTNDQWHSQHSEDAFTIEEVVLGWKHVGWVGEQLRRHAEKEGVYMNWGVHQEASQLVFTAL